MVNEEFIKQLQEWVAGWVTRNFFVRGAYQLVSRGSSSRGLPFLLNHLGVIDTSFTSIPSPLPSNLSVASGDYLIMPRLELASGVTLFLDGELVLIA